MSLFAFVSRPAMCPLHSPSRSFMMFSWRRCLKSNLRPSNQTFSSPVSHISFPRQRLYHHYVIPKSSWDGFCNFWYSFFLSIILEIFCSLNQVSRAISTSKCKNTHSSSEHSYFCLSFLFFALTLIFAHVVYILYIFGKHVLNILYFHTSARPFAMASIFMTISSGELFQVVCYIVIRHMETHSGVSVHCNDCGLFFLGQTSRSYMRFTGNNLFQKDNVFLFRELHTAGFGNRVIFAKRSRRMVYKEKGRRWTFVLCSWVFRQRDHSIPLRK